MRLPPSALIAVTLLFASPVFVRSQGPAVAAGRRVPSFASVYDNSPEGLRWQLQDLLNAARGKDPERLKVMIERTEIANPEQWFLRTFGHEKGDPWGASYENNLAQNEKSLAQTLGQLVDEDGEFSIRRINTQPAPARTIETAMVDSLQRPLDIYFATWNERGAMPGSGATPIGYFVFLDGAFRLDSAVSSAEMQLNIGASRPDSAESTPPPASPAANVATESKAANSIPRAGTNGIGFPSCDYCPDPAYTSAAKRNRLEGMVTLQATILPSGDLTDIEVVKSPDAELSRMATDGVSRWHMNPARLANGDPVAVRVPIEITFRLQR